MKIKEDVSDTFIWKVHLSELKNSRNYSDTSTVGGLKWQIIACPRLCDENSCGAVIMYLAVADASGLPVGWSRLARPTFPWLINLTARSQ
ncbi:putative ubiquitinyl hydrolase 1 [Rosa chinensis]|uniref:Putative ubiquitinyl hydrolase 1 n=1 Tax=Rosa chinensis TaxID=74649 RepID=A0A2P6QD23_ROSCH|nr:putative ubiquitinyl hydrolase 1 [Rosa chinensis]